MNFSAEVERKSQGSRKAQSKSAIRQVRDTDYDFSGRPFELLPWKWLALTAAVCSVSLAAFAEGTNQNRFGFTGPEIFPIDNQLVQLRVADLDGDGLNDLIVVNNARSKINLL